ncbi:hypothetical protein D3C85_1473920 [compost metagenome]
MLLYDIVDTSHNGSLFFIVIVQSDETKVKQTTKKQPALVGGPGLFFLHTPSADSFSLDF